MSNTTNTASSSNTSSSSSSTSAVTSSQSNTNMQQQQQQQMQIFMPIKDIMSQKLTMFNYKLPSDRTMYESSLIYCNLCDFSCDLTDKSAIICHYLSKHPDDNIVYSYLWPQMELNAQTQIYKIKYYLIKANLKVRTKETKTLQFPTSILEESEKINTQESLEENTKYVLDKMLDWLEKETNNQSSNSQTQSSQEQDAVQELEEEQEVQEVEMSGEDSGGFDPSSLIQGNEQLEDLIKLSSSALYHTNQQKYLSNLPVCLQLDNNYLVHLLAINKIENVFRVKQIHDYYGGCFVCGKQVEFNMKHYQTHFNTELTVYLCLHCNYKEYKQEQGAKPACGSSSPSSSSICSIEYQNQLNLDEPYQIDSTDLSQEEKALQIHMSECHSIDFNQILQQHQQLTQNEQQNEPGVVVIESTPMNDMYLSVQIKSIKFIDDDLLRRDLFRSDMIYSCPICTGDINIYQTASSTSNTSSCSTSSFSQFENVTFDYLSNHFLHHHQFKAIPLFVCTICNCARVSLIDCVYHYIRYHFNKKIQIGLCALNVYDRIQHQLNSNSSPTPSSSKKSQQQQQLQQQQTSLQTLPVAATTTNTIYASGPLVYCSICNENYSNEQTFIRHSFLAHLLDPNLNLNWFKVYTPITSTNQPMSSSFESSLQQIAAGMAMADLNDPSISLVDANGQPISADSTNLNLMYECPLCFKSVQSKDSITRHLLYHALNEHYEYDITCSTCNKQLSPLNNLAECLLHTREFRSHRLNINFSKYILSTDTQHSNNVQPMVSCVLCNNECGNLLASMSHILLDHFGYDSGVLHMKRFVNHMLKSLGLSKTPSKPLAAKKQSKDTPLNPELVEYFNSPNFPSLIDELVVSLVNSKQSQTSSKPDSFFTDIKCFKCGKFSTKLKNSLFSHLSTVHLFDTRDLDKLFDLHIQKQLELIDQMSLVEKYEKSQKEMAQYQLNLLKESKEKSQQQYQQQKETQKALIQQQIEVINQTSPVSLTPTSSSTQIQEVQEPTRSSTPALPMSTQSVSCVVVEQTSVPVQEPEPVIVVQQEQQVAPSQAPQTVPSKPAKTQISSAAIDRIDSTIDQVLSQICKDDYDNKPEPMLVDNNQTNSNQITVHAQPPEAENLFVFKCNLCEPYTTDDATQLLEHYKLMHQVELTIADSSTLLAAAVAAFQTGHTIEMTGAILNTISSVTDENGLTIISGEEVPVHTTVQYKCTICQMIFYEKQYIVQHLYEMHNFEIDISYFEEIEMQQQEQLQQKIYEQQQEQLMLQQQQLEQQQVNQEQSQQQQQQQQQAHQTEQNHQVSAVVPSEQHNTNIADETAAVMMMMMNGTLTTAPASAQATGIILQQNQIQNLGDIPTAQIVINPQNITQLDPNSIPTAILATAIPAISIDSSSLANIPQQTAAKPTINYTCTYCTFGADKLKKMSDHLKQSHPLREKTCMDNIRQQTIRLPNEDLPPYNQNPTTVASLLNMHQQQQQQQKQSAITAPQTQAAVPAKQPTNNNNLMDSLSSSLINLTTSLATASSSLQEAPKQVQQQVQQQQQAIQAPAVPAPAPTGRKRGPKPKTSPNTSTRPQTVANTLSKQQQLQNSGIKTPTILTMDANSQIIIDFNQNDDLLCSYCDYTMNNLNYMRTHIKYKHRNMPITFQNKLTYRFYTIVEWPLTPVPTLTPASTNPPPPPPTQQQQQAPPTPAPAPVVQQPVTTTPQTTEQTNAPQVAPQQQQQQQQEPQEAPKPQIKTQSTKENKDIKPVIPSASPGAININNVNSILKKLGVNKNISSGASPLANLISSIGAGKTANNSVVNVNLNVLKDVNIDDMIDDDDDEERKFLIKELEKKANQKRVGPGGKDQTNNNGYNSDSGSASGGIKRSRSNSSTNTQRNPLASPTGSTNTDTSKALAPLNSNQSNLLSQLNITLNCHYCWAQFQLNVTKNLKNSIQQKENGKYMQHLNLHLNAPYKCNECSYPITDTKTFFKHKQFYKHDEKTCIMVDNDICPSGSNSQVARRKTLIATRLRQHLQQQQQLKEEEKQMQTAEEESNEIQLYHDRDSFKCTLCYGDTDSAPSTSVSCLNKTPTSSTLGASNFSFDKEQVLKHVLIVHLSFLAYKCDTCAQFYAFDEPQTKQHAALVHHCGIGSAEGTTCHFKLIKTEEEINLAINRAQQFINKIPATAKKDLPVVKPKPTPALPPISSTTPIEAQPKYKCCKCNTTTTTSTNSENSTNELVPLNQASSQTPVLLYTYQDALDHVMNVHMSPSGQQQQQKKDKKVNYELELFEQNLEDLLASETGIITTISASSVAQGEEDDFEDDIDEEQGELADDYYYGTQSDLTEWNVILSEPLLVSTSSQINSSPLSPQNNRRKRFKTNNNQSISFSQTQDSDIGYLTNFKKLKRFYFKPYFIYKCNLCSRKMNSFEPEHWLKHDLENHQKLYNTQIDTAKFIYHQISCTKSSAQNTRQISKTYKCFTEFMQNFKSDSLIPSNLNDSDISYKLINCLICGIELKYAYADVLKHFQSEHEFNIFDLGLDLNDLELVQALQMNNQLQLSQGVNLRRKCFIKLPPLLLNPSVSLTTPLTKVDLIDKEINLLKEIYREQIVEKQIVSWLNSEQFLRRNFNYNSHVCIICNSSKMSILESHYNLKKGLNINNNATNSTVATSGASATTDSGRLQYFTEEMKTVVLTNHVLGHFNEYCYRCMSCKISWPDRTQLLKHAQECSNSQVVRTKTKYKLKANCRLQLKFYLQTYLDYWSHEKSVETKSIESLVPKKAESKLECRVFMKDIFLSKKMLLDVASKFDLSAIYLDETKRISLRSEVDQENSLVDEEQEEKIQESKVASSQAQDVQMKEEESEK